MADEHLQFETLAITFGCQLLIHPDPSDKTKVFSSTLIGCMANESLIVAPPANGVFPDVTEGQKIAVRIFLDDGIALFLTTVLFIADIPAVMIYLDYPAQVKFKRLRSFKRVKVSQPVIVNNVDNKAIVSVAGRLVDVSVGGGRIEMFNAIGCVGDRIEIKGKFHIQGIVRLLTVNACIRKHEKNSYGVEFVEQDEEKLIVLMGFIFNAMLTGTVDTIS